MTAFETAYAHVNALRIPLNLNLNGGEVRTLAALVIQPADIIRDEQTARVAVLCNVDPKAAKGAITRLITKGILTDRDGSLYLTDGFKRLSPTASEVEAPAQLDLPAAAGVSPGLIAEVSAELDASEPTASAADVSFLLSAFAAAAGDLVIHVKDNGALAEEQQASLRVSVESLAALCGLKLSAAPAPRAPRRTAETSDLQALRRRVTHFRYHLKAAEAAGDAEKIKHFKGKLAEVEAAIAALEAGQAPEEKPAKAEKPVEEKKAEKPAKAEKPSRAPRTAEPADDFAAAAPAPAGAAKKASGRTRTVKTFGASA